MWTCGGTHVCVCMYVWTCLWGPEVDIECLSWLPTTLFVGRLFCWTFNLLFQPVSLTTLLSCLSFPIWDYGRLPHPPPSSTWAISPALFLSFIRRCGLTKSPRQALYLWSDCHGTASQVAVATGHHHQTWIHLFFVVLRFTYFTWLFCLCVGMCLCVTCVPGAHRGQNRLLDPLELEFQVMKHHMDAGKINLGFVHWQYCYCLLSHLSSPTIPSWIVSY